MYFSNAADLLSMSGHGFYVWLAFGFSFFWLAYLLLTPIRKKYQLLKTIRAQQQIEEARKTSRQ